MRVLALLLAFLPLFSMAQGIVAPSQVPQVVYTTAPPAGTSSISATTMFTPSVAGNYRFTYYVTQTALGTSCTGNTTVTVSLIAQDISAAGPQTLGLTSYLFVNNGTLGVGSPGSGNVLVFTIRAKAGAAIQFSTTFTPGATCAPAPTVQIFPMLEYIGS